ncbi:MAG: rod shape-determining protein RodA [Clostridia bacterium]|nr:rod shape-determining protein RodA [Clostridia bacterium]
MEQIAKKKKMQFDFVLAGIILALMLMGLLMLANATGKPGIEFGSNWLDYIQAMDKSFIVRHLIWFVLGCAVAGGLMAVDYRAYGRYIGIAYIAIIALLIAVLVFGVNVYGQKRLVIGGASGTELQPSEMAKVVLIIMLAKDMSKYENGITTLKQLFTVLLKAAIPLVLMLQDIGTSVVYIFIMGVLLFVGGTRMWMLFSILGGALVSIVPIWNVLGDPQKLRILTFLDPTLDPTGTGYNVIHSKMAIGSGQILGKGFFNPTAMSQLNYIPVQESDFIFAVTGETLGFWGTSFIVLLFAALIFRMVYLATKVEDKFGSLIIIGVASMMFIHIFENVGMSIGIMPVTGIPLPFFSYGGSSMITNMMGIGLVECVWLRRKPKSRADVLSFT